METVNISKEEYDELLNYKNLVLKFEKELHKNDPIYNVARDVSSKVSNNEMKVYDESEVL